MNGTEYPISYPYGQSAAPELHRVSPPLGLHFQAARLACCRFPGGCWERPHGWRRWLSKPLRQFKKPSRRPQPLAWEPAGLLTGLPALVYPCSSSLTFAPVQLLQTIKLLLASAEGQLLMLPPASGDNASTFCRSQQPAAFESRSSAEKGMAMSVEDFWLFGYG